MKACSCVLVPIILFCLFLGLIVLFIFNAKDISIKLNSNTKIAQTSTEVKNVLNKIEAKPAGNQAKIVITEEDFNILISEYLKNIFASPETRIHPDKITTTGILEDFFKAKAVITINPKVEKEKLSMQITTIKIGFISAPEFIKEKISTLISENIEQKINTEGKISNILLENGKMTVTIEPKE